MSFTDQDYRVLKTRYEAVVHGHVFAFFKELTPSQQEIFYSQLASIQVEQVSRIAQDILTMGHDNKVTQDPAKTWRDLGLQLIGQNRVAAILMTGGQGTRLCSSPPKGCYYISLPSHKCLFQLHADRILRLQTLSKQKKIRATNNYFGLDKSNFLYFQQGAIPCFTLKGILMFEQKDKMAITPDGNGGLYDALYKQGIITSLKQRVTKPVFVEHCVFRQTDCSINVVPKSHPEEPVGVGVVEFSEISEFSAHQSTDTTSSSSSSIGDEVSSLVFGSSNIVSHLFSTGFLESASIFADQLEYHTFSALHVNRSSEFSLVKNGPGATRQDMFKLHAKHVEQAGRVVAPQVKIELSPLVSYFGEGLAIFEGKIMAKSGIIHALVDISTFCL
ncbi:nucleotide-diphospho-sugar transferase [Phycomyces blakesleeanus]|uniref:UDP-N-acetylglucosamine diphosphorylase n=1 Tax=Phycomyces blakesleeanus TaxID=4837 RepID=A0ABR3BF56_PHYBL